MRVKAVALFSGGLDSILAAKLTAEKGIEVEALHFNNPFSTADSDQKKNLFEKIRKQLKIKFKDIALGEDYLEVIQSPKHGYGKNLNPCIDCRVYMLKEAKKYMEKVKASFLVTGEVLGQRPMSQYRPALAVIEKEAGLEGLILRPLSAGLLGKTIPEKKGWIHRDSFLSISGRSRKEQLRLAEEFKIKDYFWAAGGCLLTDPGFSRRFADVKEKDKVGLAEVELLKVGRHFRLTPFFRLIVGRDRKENAEIEKLKKETDFIFLPKNVPGPTGLGRGKIDEPLKDLCVKIIARYSLKEKMEVKVINQEKKINQTVSAQAPGAEAYKEFII